MIKAEIIWQYAGKLTSALLPLDTLPRLLASDGIAVAAAPSARILRTIDAEQLQRPASDLFRFELAGSPTSAGAGSTHQGLLTLHRNGAFIVEFRHATAIAQGRLPALIDLAVLGRRDARGPDAAQLPFTRAQSLARRLDSLIAPWAFPDARHFDGGLEVQSVGLISSDAATLGRLRTQEAPLLAAFANLDPHFHTRLDAATAANFARDLSIDTELSVFPAQNALLVLLDSNQREPWRAHIAKTAALPVDDDICDRAILANYLCFAEWALLECATAEHFLRWYEGIEFVKQPEPLLTLRERALQETLAVRDFPKEREHGVRVADAVRSVRHVDETYLRTDRRRALLESISTDRHRRRQDRLILLVSLVALGTVGWSAAELYVEETGIAARSTAWLVAKAVGVAIGVVIFAIAFSPQLASRMRLAILKLHQRRSRARALRARAVESTPQSELTPETPEEVADVAN